MHDHGGGAAGADFQRVAQLPLHEAMASHGFVTVVALHSANPVARVRDLSLVIDMLLARSAANGDLLSDSIDPDRIGISGHSAGGAAAIGAAGGWAANGIVADSRIKAMVLYEPGLRLRWMTPAPLPFPTWSWAGCKPKWPCRSSLVRCDRRCNAAHPCPEPQRHALQLSHGHGLRNRPDARGRLAGRSGAPRAADRPHGNECCRGTGV